MSPKAATRTDSRLAARLAAIASLGAAIVHFAVAPAHWQEWMPSGVFFASIGIFQLIWAQLVLARSTPRVLAAGITINVGVVAMWGMSRTSGAPFGPHAGAPELTRAADLCAVLLQIYVVMGAGWVLYRGNRREPIPALGNAIVLVGAGAVIALASTVGVASGLQHGDHGPAGAAADHHGTGVGTPDAGHGHAEPATSPPIMESIGVPAAPSTVAPRLPAAKPLHDDHGGDHHGE